LVAEIEARFLYTLLGFQAWGVSGSFGRLLPFDTSSILLNSYSKGLDGLKLFYKDGEFGLYYGIFSGKRWVSDGEYYFNPMGRR